MNYEDSYDEFEGMLETFCHDIDLQMVFIQRKIEHYISCYDNETTDAARADCLKYIGKLNNLYLYYFIDKAYFTLGLQWGASEEEVKRKRDALLDRYKKSKDRDSIKMHNDVEKAYDVLQCFKT